MDKPGKRVLSKQTSYAYLQYDKGYNHACDEWEEWLPSVEKINLVIVDFFSNKHHQPIFMDALKCEELAEAISERLKM